MKEFEEMTTKDWCRLYATMNMLLDQKVITFDLDKSYVEFHANQAMSYLENQNVELNRVLSEFENWLETNLILEKAQQTDKMYIKGFQECLDKLQELKVDKNEKYIR